MNKKDFETASVTAERLGVTVRAVQKWAAAGKIAGAEKIGRTWFIPKGASLNEAAQQPDGGKTDKIRFSSRQPMPLLNSSFPLGKCTEYINTIPDEDDRTIAMAEYFFYRGEAEKAIGLAEKYIDSNDLSLRYSAAVLSIYANLSSGNPKNTVHAMTNLGELLHMGLSKDASPEIRALCVLTLNSAYVLWHKPLDENLPELEDYLRYLPEGYRLWGCYMLAHKAYLEKDYSRALAVADMGLVFVSEKYPVPAIYVHLVAVMALMSLRRVEEAKKRFETAWSLAKDDGFIEPIAEHHGLMYGMIEVYFKRTHPKDYERIIATSNVFSVGWREIHNSSASAEVTSLLTATEFTVAMLYSRGWSAQDIAGYMELAESTVRNYIKTIYIKLAVSDRHGLQKYMLK